MRGRVPVVVFRVMWRVSSRSPETVRSGGLGTVPSTTPEPAGPVGTAWLPGLLGPSEPPQAVSRAARRTAARTGRIRIRAVEVLTDRMDWLLSGGLVTGSLF
jgi:hypothetical protein